VVDDSTVPPQRRGFPVTFGTGVDDASATGAAGDAFAAFTSTASTTVADTPAVRVSVARDAHAQRTRPGFII
jgi:hypothetical protein